MYVYPIHGNGMKLLGWIALPTALPEAQEFRGGADRVELMCFASILGMEHDSGIFETVNITVHLKAYEVWVHGSLKLQTLYVVDFDVFNPLIRSFTKVGDSA